MLNSCSDKPDEVSIFAIPSDAIPSELSVQGFRCYDDYSARKLKPDDILHFSFDMGYGSVHINYLGEDTSTIYKYEIFMDEKPFRLLSGLKAGEYEKVEIHGYPYKVSYSPGIFHLQIKRLDI
jgi:hypothetical protein